MSDILRPHGLQHNRAPCPSLTPRVYTLKSIESVMASNQLILCPPLLFPSSICPSIRVFSNESVPHIRWPKDWNFSFDISPSNENSGLISFRIYWLDFLAVQGTLKSLLQHHSSKTSVLWCSAFFIVQLSHPYMTTEKTIAFIIWTFVGKVKSLLFNMLSRLVITFLPRSTWWIFCKIEEAARVLHDEQHPGELHHPPGGDKQRHQETVALHHLRFWNLHQWEGARGVGGRGGSTHWPPDQGLKGDPKSGSHPRIFSPQMQDLQLSPCFLLEEGTAPC